MPACGPGIQLPFQIDVGVLDPFSRAIEHGIKVIAQKDANFLKNSFDISTNSADIPLEERDFDATVGQVIEKYGTSAYCIRLGTAFTPRRE
ncbi:MAG: hypothetical protein ACTSUE_20610 [Promethearchaeota archaeon]